MHVSTTASGRAAGCWADVRRHPEKVLPVQWGFWKTRYCLAGPTQMSYFKRNNLTAEPNEVVECDSIKRHPDDSRVACVQRERQTVSWLMFVDAATCDSFIAAALRMNQAAPMSLYDDNGHSVERQKWASSQLQLEAVQAQLARHETELASYRARFEPVLNTVVNSEGGKRRRHSLPPSLSTVSENAGGKSDRQSLLSCPGSRLRSSSPDSPADTSDDEPLMPQQNLQAVMDWPLSKAEKKLRLLQIMDRERQAVERQNRRLKRRSAPDRSPCEPRVSSASSTSNKPQPPPGSTMAKATRPQAPSGRTLFA